MSKEIFGGDEKPEVLKEKEFELKTMAKKLPEWVSPEWLNLAQAIWLALTEKADIPRPQIDKEIPHHYGPLGVMAAAVAKSEIYQEPKLEIHLTACPSYLDDYDWEKALVLPDPVFVYESVNWMKIRQLQNWIGQVRSVDKGSKLIEGIYLHTSSPDDLNYAGKYPGLFGIFGKSQGRVSCEKHWAQMKQIADYCGLILMPDVGYMLAEAGRMGVNLNALVKNLGKERAKFLQSRYIYDAYVKWGAKSEAVLEVFYAGSVLGYGNSEADFSLSNDQPLKIYINCEEGWSPETFAGVKTGVDFRHLLPGFHLALLVSSIRTPWSGKVLHEQTT